MRYFFVFLTLSALCACSPPSKKVQAVDFYGNHYQDCLQKARLKTEYTHDSIQEETLGHALNNCMTDLGWIMDGKELN